MSGTLICICFLVFFYNILLRDYVFSITQLKILTFVSVLVSLHFSIASFLYDNFNFLRGLMSIILLILIIYSASLFSNLIISISDEKFNKYINIVFIGFVLSFLGINIHQIQNPIHQKSIFPYNEPSHFSLFYLPIFYYLVLKNNYIKRVFYIAISLYIGWVLENMTLIVGVFFIVAIAYNFKSFIILPIIVFIVITYFNLDYFLERINFDISNTNLSVLTFLQGWQMAFESLKKTYGFGIGFQQLGFVKINTDAGDIIYRLLGSNPNETDAGLTFGKVVSEFGIFGLFLIFFYLKYLVIFIKNIIFQNTISFDSKILFSYAVFISFFIDIFVRGIGYFNPPFFLFLVAVFIILKSKKK